MGFIVSFKPSKSGPKMKIITSEGEVLISTEKVSGLLRLRVDAPQSIKLESLVKKELKPIKQLANQLSFEDVEGNA